MNEHKKRLLNKLELHFKCDCMACIDRKVDGGNIPISCGNEKKCEVAISYNDIISEIEKMEITVIKNE